MKALFTGVYTETWSYSGMLVAAQRMKNDGIDTWCLKVNDGAHMWYGGLQNAIDLCKNILGSVSAQGLNIIPYGYSYGNKYGALTTEIAIAEVFIHAGLPYCFDMEIEWNGQTVWIDQVVTSLAGKTFYVTSWADPLVQNWQGLLQLLSHDSHALFMPQVYTPYLNGVWIDQYVTCGVPLDRMIPVYNSLTLQNAVQHATSGKSYALWDYSSLTDSEIRMVTNGGVDYKGQAMKDCWNSCSNYLKSIPPYDTGIAQSWKDAYTKGVFYGPPLTPEYSSVDWQGNAIKAQQFAGGRAEYNPTTQKIAWYS